MQSTLPKDKIILDVSDKDDKDLAEHLSRMEPGDILTSHDCSFSLDENADGLAILSVIKFNADPEIESAKPKKKNKTTDVAGEDELAAVKVMRGQTDDDLPPDPIPSGEPAKRQAPSQPYSPDELVR